MGWSNLLIGSHRILLVFQVSPLQKQERSPALTTDGAGYEGYALPVVYDLRQELSGWTETYHWRAAKG